MDEFKNTERTDYEPNFIMKDAEAAPAAEPDVEVKDLKDLMDLPDHSAKAGEAEAAPEVKPAAAEVKPAAAVTPEPETKPAAEAPEVKPAAAEAKPAAAEVKPAEAPEAKAPESIPQESESPAAEILRAAAAKADALKAAAAKVDPASETYRRETSEIASESPVGSLPREEKTISGSRFSGEFSEQPYDRPKYENPSFDPGVTGHYKDPRSQFRMGESASWSNGEVHRSRRQMKDSIHKQEKKRPAKPVMLTRKALALMIAGCLCLSCLFGLGGAALGMTMMQKNQAATAQTQTAQASTEGATAHTAGYTLESATGSNMTIKEITAASKNSVVEIRTESVASDSWMQQYVTEGAGSGVIISEDGYIMTNNHVIEGAGKITVTTADEKEYSAKLIGTDETNDVAVIKIDATGLSPATYGNSSELEVGDMAVAIGNPLGELGGTVTAGIISATDRELAIDGKTMHLLQTDSSINPGNSGGGLFNGSGQLIGLVVAKSSGSDVEGLGFAIPINTAADVAQQLIDKGYVSGQPSTGMTYQEGTASSGSNNPFSSFDSLFGGNAATGVYIYSVNGENAQKAGFQPGDQVYAVDGEEITSFDDLSSIVTSHKVGDTLKFTILRDGVQKNIKLELEEKTAVSQTDPNGQGQNGQDQNGQTQDPNAQNGQDQNGQDGQNGQNGQDQNGQNGQNDQADPGMGGSWQDWFNMFF